MHIVQIVNVINLWPFINIYKNVIKCKSQWPSFINIKLDYTVQSTCLGAPYGTKKLI